MSERLGFEKHYNVEVAGILGKIVFKSMPLSLAEARFYWNQGVRVPLEIMPSEFWREPGTDFPRFGEEMLGAEF